MKFNYATSWLMPILVLISFMEIQANVFGEIHTNRANYLPGNTIEFELIVNELPRNNLLKIEYYHLNQIIDSTLLSTTEVGKINWSWEAPELDYKGYLVRVLGKNNKLEDVQTSIAIDVSSDWNRFPRYGFLSDFSILSESSINETIKKLNRYHINGIQYYDWHYKHHLPLKGNPTNPDTTWLDIANRTNHLSTIKKYIDMGHSFGMKSMAYNLLYGAYENAESDGVPTQWRLFKDVSHSNPDFHALPDSWASDIYLIDPSNPQWISFLLSKMSDVFNALPFDGWHLDQLGDRGNRYNYGGQLVELAQTFLPFLEKTKTNLNVSLVMNAVNQFGQSGIAQSPVDFLYTEVWENNNSFASLVGLILNNNTFSDNKLSTVLAAYLNYSLSTQEGYFNTPGVILADAVIFAAGGSHLELGEHMLSNEYFPNENLKMSDDLEISLIQYYDFMVSYQNLLRDGGDFNQVYLKSQEELSIKQYSQIGSIWNFSKLKNDSQIFHLINFKDANSLNWRDDFGTQTEPDTLHNINVAFSTSRKVKDLWIASPDFNDGCPQNITFTQKNDTVGFVIPHLKYWDMIVADYSTITNIESSKSILQNEIKIIGNYPNPFNPETIIEFQLNNNHKVKIEIFNVLGQQIEELANKNYNEGNNSISWKPKNGVPSGIYICRLAIDGQGIDQKKLIYLK